MDVIFVIENGIPQTPQLIENEITGEATFDSLAEELLGDDYEELSAVDYGYRLDEANRLLEGSGKQIVWFTDIEVNTWNNDEPSVCWKCDEEVDGNATMCPHCLTSL